MIQSSRQSRWLASVARLGRRREAGRLGVALLLVAAPIYFLRGYLAHPSWVGAFGDIRDFQFWWEVSRKEVLQFGQLPFWNPYYCGGMVHWANVQTMFLAPTFVVNLLFGAGIGIRVHIFLHFIAGFVGCYVLSRYRGLRLPWALAPGVVFVFGANLAERSTGHLSFMPFLLLPWLLYCYERSRSDVRFVVPSALLVAYCVFAGGPYPFALFCLYVIAQVAMDSGAGIVRAAGDRRARRSVNWRPVWRPWMVGAAIGALAVAVAAVKLFVVLDFMHQYPRHIVEHDYLAKWQVWETFLQAPLVRARKGYFYVFGEYRNYLGPIAMAAVPKMLLRWRSRWRDYGAIIIFGVLMLGNLGPYAPYTLLQRLPIFDSLRVPVRYALLVDLHIGLLFGHMLADAAQAVHAWPSRALRRAAYGGLGLALLVCAGDLMTNNNTQLAGFFNTPDRVPPRAGPFRQILGNSANTWQGPPRNEGQIRCYEPNPLRISAALRPNSGHEVYVAARAGQVQLLRWTPNALDVRARLPTAGIVVVNQNYHRDWHVRGGRLLNYRGLLAARVDAGSHRVHFEYRPRRFALYALLSAAGVGACAAVLWLSRRRRSTPA